MQTPFKLPTPLIPDEPQERAGLLEGLLLDADGQEDFYLSEIARAEAGEDVPDLYNHYIHVYLYPTQDRVILEELRYSEKDEQERGPPARTELTLAELKQLLLDWLEAKRLFYAERRPDAAQSPVPSTSK